VKAYIIEQGSAWVRSLLDPGSGHRVYVAIITGPEVVSAIVRRANRREISKSDAAKSITAFRQDFTNNLRLIEISLSVIDRSMDLGVKHGIRGYDAVQLAVAIKLKDERSTVGLSLPVFVSADASLNSAASSERFVIDDPNIH
jgi:predicted nucleic acid-binding protein